MNLPNKLTMLRIILVPVFVLLLLKPMFGEANKWVVLTIFCIACFTDFLDGKIADPAKLQAAYRTIADENGEVIRQVDDLLDLVRTGKGTRRYARSTFLQEMADQGYSIGLYTDSLTIGMLPQEEQNVAPSLSGAPHHGQWRTACLIGDPHSGQNCGLISSYPQ